MLDATANAAVAFLMLCLPIKGILILFIIFLFFPGILINRSKKEFTYAFKDADTVILCPIYTAGEKIKLGFNYEDFAKKIIKNSNVKLYMVENNNQLSKYLKQNMYGKKIVVGMGAGSISNWIKELPSLM